MTGVLLINLGTPASPNVADVRRYLREFLGDPKVINLNPLARWLLLNLVILPFRPRRSAAAYRKIWTDEGSPLLVHGQALREAVARRLGDEFSVALGMRYGEPRLETALEQLATAGVERIVALPLFPQSSSATTGSVADALAEVRVRNPGLPPVTILDAFFDAPEFIAALAEVSRQPLADFRPDHTLVSYHGLPEELLRAEDATGSHCLVAADCCARMGDHNRGCYRAQCFATTRALAHRLDLGADAHTTAFQSRFGRTPWIRPYVDDELQALAANGVKRLAIVCPSFAADCLETLEEIGIRADERWRELGGEALGLIPCLNTHRTWVEAVAGWMRSEAVAGSR